MKNPWPDLPRRPPFVLREDAPYIEVFNRTAPKSATVDTTLMPGPFLGDPASPVIILALNPGWSPEDRKVNRERWFRRMVQNNLRHRFGAQPFVPLTGDQTRPGAQWWRRNLKAVLSAVGEERAAQHLCCLEYFPYHSRTFAHASLRIPSQEYTFHLLREALARRAVVILTRGERFWTGAVPELANYRRIVRTRTARTACMSPGNCGPGFDVVIRELRGAAI